MEFLRPRVDLLTRSSPRVDAKALLKSFSRSIRPVLESLSVGRELRYKETGVGLALTIGADRVSIRSVGPGYWVDEDEGQPAGQGENDLWEYGPRAAWKEEEGVDGAEGLEEAICESKGAIIIESMETPDPQAIIPVLAHLAAAASDDSVAMIIPTSGSIHPVTAALRSALRQCSDIFSALRYILRMEYLPVEGDSPLVRIAVESRAYWYASYGLHPFGLPDVGTAFPVSDDPDVEQEAAAAVQSFVAYLLQRRSPVPIGDTITVGGGRSYRVVEADFPANPHGNKGQVALTPA